MRKLIKAEERMHFIGKMTPDQMRQKLSVREIIAYNEARLRLIEMRNTFQISQKDSRLKKPAVNADGTLRALKHRKSKHVYAPIFAND